MSEAERVAKEIGLGENDSSYYRETFRRLSDGITIRTQPSNLRGWINVNIMGQVGYYLCQQVIPIDEAFGEIPFLLDRARHFDRLFSAQNASETETVTRE